jgi:uncharacterized protein
MQINLSKLFEKEHSEQELTCPLEADTVAYGGETYDFVNKSDVELKITHTSKRQVTVNGHSKFQLRMRCARCLEPVEVPFDLHFDAELDLNRPADSEDELPYIRGYSLDVDLLVMDELFVNMPISVLCKCDCKGLCRVCGTNLNHKTCDCDSTVLDPRMAKILDIFNAKNKEV